MKRISAYLQFFIILLVFPFFVYAKQSDLYIPVGDKEPVTYNSAVDGTSADFFKKNYKKTWDKLSDFEQYAIAFSSNLFELNSQYHLDFSNRTILNKKSSDPKELLRESWDVTDNKSLIEMFNSLEEYGQSGAFKTLSDLLDKYPDKTILDIAVNEKLSILDTTRLFYVDSVRDVLGRHGIEAWDEGRQITIIRWGIACDYISREQAEEFLKPVVNRIRKNYVSWEDYIMHYIYGRKFYALYNCSYEKLAASAIAAAERANAYIPLYSIKFSGENADKKKAFKEIKDVNDFSEDFIKWKQVQVLYNQEQTADMIKSVEYYESIYSDYSDLFFWWHMVLLQNFGTDNEVISLLEAHYDYLSGLPTDGEVFANSMYYYIVALNNTVQPEKMLDVMATLPDNLRTNIYYYYQYAYANYLMLSLCETQLEFNTYKSRAIGALTVLSQYDFEIDPFIASWFEHVK